MCLNASARDLAYGERTHSSDEGAMKGPYLTLLATVIILACATQWACLVTRSSTRPRANLTIRFFTWRCWRC